MGIRKERYNYLYMTNSQRVVRRNFKDYSILILQGIAIGAANAVPGVSGGTMALIFGIYQELMVSIKTLGDKQFLQALLQLRLKKAWGYINWSFLSPLIFGAIIAILLLAQVLEYLLENKASLVWSFFFGLIAASVFSVGHRAKHWRFPTIAALLLGAAIAFGVVGLTPAKTPENLAFIFIAGAISACAFILPGISGAFILVLLGKYEFIIQAVNQKDILSLATLALGGVVGLVTFAKFLSWLFKSHYNLTIALLTGFILGSLWKVWPWQEEKGDISINVLPSWQIDGTFNFDILYAILLVMFGFLVVVFVDPETFLRRKVTIKDLQKYKI